MDRYLVAVLAACLAPGALAGGFLDDSKGSLALRNFYMDRDFRSGSGQSQAREWAQGFTLKLDSGYTDGPVGFGLSFLGMAGYKLDSSPDRTGTGLLAYDPVSREVDDQYAKAGLTARLKASRSELQLGTVQPLLPIAYPITARLFPPVFRGAFLQSREFDALTLHGGYFDRQKFRDSSNDDKLRVSAPNKRFNGTAESDFFGFGGGEYRISEQLTGSYYFAQLRDLYRQHYAGLTYTSPLGPGRLKGEAFYFRSTEDGAAAAGPVDNGNLNLNLSYQLGADTLRLGHMRLSGDTGMPYLSGTDPYLIVGGSLVSEYVNPDERVWQLRYEHDFAAQGLPGLSALVRVVHGDNVQLPQYDWRGREWERDLELGYVVQSGSLAGLGLRLRQGHYQSDFARDVDEVRVTIDYSLALW